MTAGISRHPLSLRILSQSRLLICGILFLVLIPVGNSQYVEVKKGGGFFSSSDKIRLYFFNDKDFSLKVLDEGSSQEKKNYGSHGKAFESANCLAGINGGFFTKENAPLGLVIQNGKQLHVLETGSFTVSGVLYDTGTQIALKRSKSFKPDKKQTIKEAIQGGPFLVEQGKKIRGLDKEKEASRTFVATDGKGKWCIGVSSPLSLDAIASWLSTSNALGEFQVKDALNLDGGSSSLFWTKETGSMLSPLKPVRNYIGVAPR